MFIILNCLQSLERRIQSIPLHKVYKHKRFTKALTLHTLQEHTEVLPKNIHIRGKIIAKLLFQNRNIKYCCRIAVLEPQSTA